MQENNEFENPVDVPADELKAHAPENPKQNLEEEGNKKAKKKQGALNMQIDKNGHPIENFVTNFSKNFGNGFGNGGGEDSPKLTDKIKEQIAKLGLDPNDVEKDLNAFGSKTELKPLKVPLPNGQNMHIEGKIMVVKLPDGSSELKIYPKESRENLKARLEKPYFGYTFTEEQKKALLSKKDGSIGEPVEVTFTGADTPTKCYIGVDQDTNTIVAVRADSLKVPEQILGVQLSQEQIQGLQAGKSVLIENMTDKTGKQFDANLKYSPSKKGFDWKFKGTDMFIPKVIGGVELNQNQIESLKAGGTTEIKDMKDKNGKLYTAGVSFDKDKFNPKTGKNGKLVFSSMADKKDLKKDVTADRPPKQKKKTGLKM